MSNSPPPPYRRISTAPGGPQRAPYPTFPPPSSFAAPPPAPAPRRPVGLIVTVSILGLLLLIAGGVAVDALLRNAAANATIREQRQQLEQQERELEEQRELIDRKEVFGAAMQRLVEEANRFAGVTVGHLVDWDRYEALAKDAWAWRWDAWQLESLTTEAEQLHAQLVATREAAEAQAADNASGTVYESVLDALGSGYVSVVFEHVGGYCPAETWACVGGADPYRVYVVLESDAKRWVTDWMRTGVAYHEMAHVLQHTHPGPTAEALEHFGGDYEHMADCFALTFLDGWTLEHTHRSGGYIYRTSIGYGYTCTAAQREVMRDWYGQLQRANEPRIIRS